MLRVVSYRSALHEGDPSKARAAVGLGESTFTFSLGSSNGVSALGKGTVVMVMGHSPLEELEPPTRAVLQRI